jgi:transposase
MNSSSKSALQLKLDSLKSIREQLLQANRQVRKLSAQERYKKQVELLRSIPGIGITNSMILLTEMGNINRFGDFAHLCSYFGLTPSVYQSDETVKVRGITSRCNHLLREALVESAWQVVRHDPALLICFKQLCKRMPPNKAIIRIARKLLRRIRHVLLKETEYVIAVVK